MMKEKRLELSRMLIISRYHRCNLKVKRWRVRRSRRRFRLSNEASLSPQRDFRSTQRRAFHFVILLLLLPLYRIGPGMTFRSRSGGTESRGRERERERSLVACLPSRCRTFAETRDKYTFQLAKNARESHTRIIYYRSDVQRDRKRGRLETDVTDYTYGGVVALCLTSRGGIRDWGSFARAIDFDRKCILKLVIW